ncbi:MAG: hypothetical protein ACI92I_000950 [Acidimicrobiales bacterium]
MSEHLHAGMMMQFRVQDENGNATGDEFRATVPASVHNNDTMNEASAEPVSNQEFTFSSKVEYTEYTVFAESTRFKAGDMQNITLTLFDKDLNGVVLSEEYPNPLGITFVKSNDTQQFYTYPGKTNFTMPDHGTSGHDDSDGHHDPEPAHDNDDGHHGFNLISTAHAHGGVEDGHAEETGRVYQYTLPVLFSEKGFYRAFVEFVPEGSTEPITLALDIEVASNNFSVDNFGWSKEMKWWILLLVSLGLMVPLVIGVRKYVSVK